MTLKVSKKRKFFKTLSRHLCRWHRAERKIKKGTKFMNASLSPSRRTFSPETLRRVGLVVSTPAIFLFSRSFFLFRWCAISALALNGTIFSWKHRQSKDGLFAHKQQFFFFFFSAQHNVDVDGTKNCAVKDSLKKRIDAGVESGVVGSRLLCKSSLSFVHSFSETT